MEQKLIKSSLFPLPVEELKEYILSKDTNVGIDPTPKFIIDYKNSTLKGRHFLSYAANLELSYMITNFTKEDLVLLMGEFLESSQFYCCMTVTEEIAKIMLEDDEASILPKETLTEFKDKYKYLLFLMKEVLSTMSYVIPLSLKWYSELFKEEQSFFSLRTEKIVNIGSLILIPDFLENFMAVNEPKKMWFPFLEEPLYYGNNFMNFFFSRTSYLALLYSASLEKAEAPPLLEA